MPFVRPYKESFTKNDLLYGLNEQRAIYIKEYQAFKSVDDDRDYIDSYCITPFEKNMNFAQTVKAKRKRHLIKTIKSDAKNIAAHTTQPFIFYIGGRKQGIENPQAVIRKTKAGLSWAAQCANTSRAFQIHFILDSIRMPEVVFKQHKIDGNHHSFKSFIAEIVDRNNHSVNMATLNYNLEYDNSIIKNRAMTGAELRWIYRNRFNDSVQSVIQFWYAGNPCCPPWEAEFDHVSGDSLSHLWRLYKPKSLQVT